MLNQGESVFNAGLLDFYREHATKTLLPFWKRAVDNEHGGIFTCFDNTGTQLMSKNKYTWSQGRFIWIWSRIARISQAGLLSEEPEFYLVQAKKTVDFLWQHAVLENGNCAFVLTETGEPVEEIPGQGYDTSFYADCFVVLGFSEYVKATRDTEILKKALILYDQIVKRLKQKNLRSEPYPIPEGVQAHSVSMIMLNVTHELYEALSYLKHPRRQELKQAALGHANDIMTVFYNADGTITELLAPEGSPLQDTVLCRHVNPGHTIECMWFIIQNVRKLGGTDWTHKAAKAVKRAFELGWDPEYGGLLRFVNRQGGKPQGTTNGDPYEKLILDTWDTKLWWPHSEALYTTLLMYSVTGDETFLRLYEKTHTHVFTTFPNPDETVGEWIQIRDRTGKPIQKVVALPVKDPYHILRNVLLTIELIRENLSR
ncbi:AGE family epimerase/isomerase [Moorella sp. Hama-1]|uniref:AGE family epimerase/isomerase n=1 Tax=Moorella sp. Hama-1 TaxID=2138101 RepID=UPI000D65E394|nr:AGE family epimerase/isomerase [Moorella sp. Hama-1]BCV22320.1 N-acylglucosamine 2-epimerase [Moorella sp. Hama-1]